MIRAGEILHYSDIVLTINNLHYVRTCIYNRLLLNILQLISQKYGRNF